MVVYEVQQAYHPEAMFYPLGIQGETLNELWNHLENNLAAWYLAMTRHAIPIEFACTCPKITGELPTEWAYAKKFDGTVSLPVRLDYEQMAKHIVGTADVTHVVTLTSAMHLRTVEIDA